MARIRVLASSVVAASLLAAGSAAASTGICDSNPPTTTDACINQIQASGGVVNDIFKDTQGHTATQLPTYGQLFNVYPGCTIASSAGCDPGMRHRAVRLPGRVHVRERAGHRALFTDVAEGASPASTTSGRTRAASTEHTLRQRLPAVRDVRRRRHDRRSTSPGRASSSTSAARRTRSPSSR